MGKDIRFWKFWKRIEIQNLNTRISLFFVNQIKHVNSQYDLFFYTESNDALPTYTFSVSTDYPTYIEKLRVRCFPVSTIFVIF